MSITPHESSSLKLNDPSRTANLKEFIKKIQTLHDTLAHRNLSAGAVCQDLKYIANALEKLNKFEDDLGKTLEDLNHNMDEIMDDANTSTNLKQIQDSASLLKNTISILKIKAPRQQQQQHSEARTSHTSGDTEIEIEDPPSESFLTEFHRKFKEEIADRGMRMQKCLLCLAVFPKNAEISKRLLKLWWLGEDLVPYSRYDETFVDNTLEKFVQLGFIEPLEKERRPGGKAKIFKVPRLVRAALIKLAKDSKFFDFGENASPIADSSEFRRVFLVNNKENRALLEKSPRDITTVFNVSESFPDLRISERSLSKMTSLGVLYLGRWEENTPQRYIEVENTGFLRGLRSMRRLRYLSLHGISKITKIPSLAGPCPLRILDLRACYNLEQLPEGLEFLGWLIYLDISDCFYIDFMPRTLATLRELVVLKGFVISGMEGSCSLTELAALRSLEKLSIVINRKDFYVEGLKDELSLFGSSLRIVKVAWNTKPLSNTRINVEQRGAAEYKGQGHSCLTRVLSLVGVGPNIAEGRIFKISKQRQQTGDLEQLEKLDLEGYPKEQPPSWLRPECLPGLKRLYIRGGNLGKLGVEGEGEKKWNVEVLRLKYLSDLEMDWKQLNALFPDLSFLEIANCRKVTNCPCDGNGIWIKTARSIESGSSSGVV